MQTGKRRQAAALLVQSLWTTNNNSSKPKRTSDSKASKPTTTSSTANSTTTVNNKGPVLEVPPMGFGPIREPNCNDVLCGRGGLINGSPGNVQFRTIVASRKKEYNAKSTKRNEKAHMAADIVRQIRNMNPPGRFLREDANGLWFDVGDARAIRKTGQALREAAPAIRNEEDGANGEINPSKKEDDMASESGSNKGKQEAKEKSSGSPKRKKGETKQTNNQDKKVSPERKPVEETHVAETQPQQEKNSKRNWFPNMSVRRSNNASPNNNIETASVSADTARNGSNSQSYLIPHSALGTHITHSHAPVVAMPRMSQGAVFSNSNHHSPSNSNSRQSRPQIAATAEHPYQHTAQYPYPYGHTMPPMHHPMHPSSPHHHHHSPTGYPMNADNSNPMMMPPMRPLSMLSEDAFGMNFFPTRDVHMENSSTLTVSDISGLSSSINQGGIEQQQQQMRRQQPPQQYYHPSFSVPRPQQPHPQSQPQPHTQKKPPTTPSSSNMEEASILDTTSSLPSFSDLLDDDVDMASANSGGVANSSVAMASVTSSTVARMFMAPPPPKHQIAKTNVCVDPQSVKENSNSTGSCLSGKSGSAVSGKSEVSLPSSCGTALSQFSDSFMALHLSDHHDFE